MRFGLYIYQNGDIRSVDVDKGLLKAAWRRD